MKVKLGTSKLQVLSMNIKGEMKNAYSPLLNLVNTTNLLGDFTSPSLNFDRYNPVDIDVVDEYDGSLNLIINDDKNYPKLINTRFSQQENNTFNIPVHNGNTVTNVYEENTFDKDTLLLKLYSSIPTLDFQGIAEGGNWKCGSYVFYFKLSDADGNLTNIVQESSIVLVHIGTPNTKKIRMGMSNENAMKVIKFKLSNIDSGFDYVRVFYERASTDDSLAMIKSYYMIELNYPIRNGTCELLFTGNENILQIDKSDLQTEFADIQTAKTLAIVDNTLFLGNISAYELNYAVLQLIAWRIFPSVKVSDAIGSINSNDYSFNKYSSFYNVENVYNHTGYWADEYYRFGIVFIYNNNLLSPVFNIQGYDLNNKTVTKSSFFQPGTGTKWKFEPEDGFFNKETFLNSKGVVKLPRIATQNASLKNVKLNTIKIKFDWSNIIYQNNKGDLEEFLNDLPKEDYYTTLFKRYNIKGFFFVRQKRIPTIIAQGMVIGLTGKEYGSLPVIKDQGSWVTKSFISKDRILRPNGAAVTVTSTVKNKALLVPDYELNQATLNSIFTSQEFQLTRCGNINTNTLGDHIFVNNYYTDTSSDPINDVKLTGVLKNVKLRTDGENFFSTLAGNADEPFKTSDVNNDWKTTYPQDLTNSVSLVRGQWGSYVGMSYDGFDYGDIVNIRLNEFKDPNHNELEFQKRFKDYSKYSAISPRVNISEYNKSDNFLYMICARGDCFQGLFTHRMMSNFIDTELPTNHLIIDPACWCNNYAVRASAITPMKSHSNLADDCDGWWIEKGTTPKLVGLHGSVASVLLLILGFNWNFKELLVSGPTEFANEIVQSFEIYLGKSSTDKVSVGDNLKLYTNLGVNELITGGHIKKVNPKELESGGGILKAIFKADDKWELHGLASINRADVNAVSFGQWITFPVCSSYNLAMRDIDFTQATEETRMGKKRAFYPYEEMNPQDHLLESEVINGAAKVSISDLQRPAYTTIPFIRLEFFNRIYWSKPNIAEVFINSYRMIYNTQYREYNKEYGAITKILPLLSNLLVVFEHGIGVLQVNRSPQSELEASPYLPLKSVLPSQVVTVSRDYGSMWKDSVLLTPANLVYGIDTSAKKIWVTSGNDFKFISDFKVLKFLNDHLNFSEFDKKEYIGHIDVKTHYNEDKHDVIFTYFKDEPVRDENGKIINWIDGKRWSLCYNEQLGKFITFYDWFPVESCNVDNIFFSFNRDEIDSVYENKDPIDFDEPIELSDKGYYTNKVFLDKSFTHNVKILLNPDLSQLNQNSGYISLYYEKANPFTKDPIFEKKFGSNDWLFGVFEAPVTSDLEYTGKIAEPRWHAEESKNKSDKDILKFFDYRSTEKNNMYLWKHGLNGLYDNQGKIKPTNWYGKQHEWNVEVIVNESPEIQKIFNNLLIISNKAAPYKFEYEVIGEGYEWYIYKEVISWINKKAAEELEKDPTLSAKDCLDKWYKYTLSKDYQTLSSNPDFPELFGYKDEQFIKKLPYLKMKLTDQSDHVYGSYEGDDYWKGLTDEQEYSQNTSETCLIEDELLREEKVHTESLALDMKKYGRLRGNMEYLEDLWKVEIRPINYQYAYVKNDELQFSKKFETRHRDKFMRMKLRYDGKDLAIILSITTLFDTSLA